MKRAISQFAPPTAPNEPVDSTRQQDHRQTSRRERNESQSKAGGWLQKGKREARCESRDCCREFVGVEKAVRKTCLRAEKPVTNQSIDGMIVGANQLQLSEGQSHSLCKLGHVVLCCPIRSCLGSEWRSVHGPSARFQLCSSPLRAKLHSGDQQYKFAVTVCRSWYSSTSHAPGHQCSHTVPLPP